MGRSKKPAGQPEADWGSLAVRLRAALPARGLTEQRMFGGIGFMLNGNMIAGVSKRACCCALARGVMARRLLGLARVPWRCEAVRSKVIYSLTPWV